MFNYTPVTVAVVCSFALFSLVASARRWFAVPAKQLPSMLLGSAHPYLTRAIVCRDLAVIGRLLSEQNRKKMIDPNDLSCGAGNAGIPESPWKAPMPSKDPEIWTVALDNNHTTRSMEHAPMFGKNRVRGRLASTPS
ncbi:hypothetical protein BC826DRAFT_1184371 [Russula brevipes]|nr:hypothetical protein BC826DRAFT_1184371 [Russula brevipes]